MSKLKKDNIGYVIDGAGLKLRKNNQIEKHIITPTNKTIVILEDGRKGISCCHPEDKFNEVIGLSLAYSRAIGRPISLAFKEDELISEKIKYNLENFRKNKFVVNCKTKNEAILFLNYLHNKGITWSSRSPLVPNYCWNYYFETTCYACNYNGEGYNRLGYSSVAFYKRKNYIVVDFKDFEIEEGE